MGPPILLSFIVKNAFVDPAYMAYPTHCLHSPPVPRTQHGRGITNNRNLVLGRDSQHERFAWVALSSGDVTTQEGGRLPATVLARILPRLPESKTNSIPLGNGHGAHGRADFRVCEMCSISNLVHSTNLILVVIRHWCEPEHSTGLQNSPAFECSFIERRMSLKVFRVSAECVSRQVHQVMHFLIHVTEHFQELRLRIRRNTWCIQPSLDYFLLTLQLHAPL